MRCPKCHYLSFDPEPRCRNCGYGLSLEADDLMIRDSEQDEAPLSPFADVNLRATADTAASRPAAASSPPPPTQTPVTEPARARSPFASLGDPADVTGIEDVTAEERAAIHLPPSPSRPRSVPTTELPLFVKGMSGAATAPARMLDEPLVQLSEDPRPPLSVRRKAPDPVVARPKPTPEVPDAMKGPLDRDLLADLPAPEPLSELQARARRKSGATAIGETVGAGRRAAAAAIDGTLLGGLSAGVMWLTLRWCDLPIDRALMLPVLIPTAGFLALLGVGYLVLFNAAGGQTLGKMAVGLRVVREVTPFDNGGPVSFGQATLRAVATLPSVLAAGLGFLPALIGEQRAVHDRLAGTRVVRA
jgi:uncharacterized RDD family membrane protein YckC